MTLPDTLKLNADTWDLEVDGFGNIAMAGTPYAQAQDVASANRLWQGEALYDTTRGLPYDQSILGKLPPPGLLASWIKTESETVSGVSSAQVALQYNVSARKLTGTVDLTLADGAVVTVSM